MTNATRRAPVSLWSHPGPDAVAGLVVFLVALPLCLGIALASGAPLFSGLVAGVVGGFVVGALSGSHTSVSGPAAGLTAVVAAEIARLGSFEAFLVAVTLAGMIQVVMGLAKLGFLAEFVPTPVIKGLLAAIGVILILKQLPHLVGNDKDPEGDMAFAQPDHENTFSELLEMFSSFRPGVALVGLTCLAILVLWQRWGVLRKSAVPSSLVVVAVGVVLAVLLEPFGAPWRIHPSHMVAVPVAKSLGDFAQQFIVPDWSALAVPAVYLSGLTIALVASLETLLNIEAIDRIDPQRRQSPPSRELIAQGVGNVACGVLGGLPVTSVIIRSSVNLQSGGRTKLATLVHGVLLGASVAFVPWMLNRIPLAALAAILLMTGVKLASHKEFKSMWGRGWGQFLPFVVTVVAIVMTDLLVGVLIGLGVSVAFILHDSIRRPVHARLERRPAGDVIRIELPRDVSFLNRASLSRTLGEAEPGTHLVIDASETQQVDPDVIDLLLDFRDNTAPAHGVDLSLEGFTNVPGIDDDVRYRDVADRAAQQALSPAEVLDLLKHGNERFRSGERLKHDFNRQIAAAAQGQFPIAALVGCIDSRVPAEMIFDVGLGDLFVARVAGNVTHRKMLGSLEYACAVAGAKLVVVLGHTRCGAVTTAFDFALTGATAAERIGCPNIDFLLSEIQQALPSIHPPAKPPTDPDEHRLWVDRLAEANVRRTIEVIRRESPQLTKREHGGEIAVVGAMYEVETGLVRWLDGAA
ncbi:MAG: bifunctional SulP family inorganic anion transporter/carbonic anhydrase [Lacipirellulaceae bacterium]